VTSPERCTFLFLANGRAFIRGEDGEVCEADAWERNRAPMSFEHVANAWEYPFVNLFLSNPAAAQRLTSRLHQRHRQLTRNQGAAVF